MKYQIISVVGSLQGAADFETLEEMWRTSQALRGPSAGIMFSLSVPLAARVRRTPGNPTEHVVLSSGDREATLIRDAFGHPEGQLCVSCDPNGADVPVDSINIQFRSLDDEHTDRGLVWVIPKQKDGDPAGAHLTIRRAALARTGLLAEIIRAAEQAVEREVLGHFTANLIAAN